MGSNFIFFGTPRISEILLEKLIEKDFNPSLVITGEAKSVGRSSTPQPTAIAALAEKNNIEVATPTSLRINPEIVEKIKSLKPQFAILSAYGKIIPQEIPDLFHLGILNPDPSLLPKYRGPSRIQTTLLNGETKTGVSVILLDNEIDHGPILSQKELEIAEDDTQESLTERLGDLSTELIIDLIPNLISGTINTQTQDHSIATYTQKVSRDSGYFDLDTPPDNLNNMIRAFYPWPGVWTKIDGKILKFLPENKVQIEGGKPVTLKEFLNGHPALKEKLQNLKLD